MTAVHAEVAVPVPLRRSFTYRIPAELEHAVREGSRVAVPFSGRKLPGVVLACGVTPPDGARIKAIAGLLDPEPLFGAELLRFLREAADYYMHPIGEVLKAAAPALPSEAIAALKKRGFLEAGQTLPGAKLATRKVVVVRRVEGAEEPARLGKRQRLVLQLLAERGEVTLDELRRHVSGARQVVNGLEERGLFATHEREVPRDRFFADRVEHDTAPTPNEEQARAIEAISARIGQGGAFLLHGVTGSGKTEVYLRVIAEARARGLGGLMLVPEIALTPQLVSRFRARFGDEIAVLHSELSERERNDAWRDLRAGRLSLAIGARSALFAPLDGLGVIVVDEEHDGSFKQEEGFRYHARDMALLRAHRAGAVCILGSATPSLESTHLARGDKLTRLALTRRATPRSLPPVEIVDLARHRGTPSGQPLITGPLHHELAACLADGHQAILFLNRRGFSPSLRCGACGEIQECPACSVALTRHKGARMLRCHYCDHARPEHNPCSECGAKELEELGMGTEQLEQAVQAAFADARVARLDRDTATGQGVEAVLDRLRRREIDVLVGTQMVTKGHDVPGVTLVGVILADQSLAFPDFRASERTFQLLAQVAGRAGRGEVEGKVVLQTYQPEHPALVHAVRHDYAAFCSQEMAAREELGYPPFSRLLAVRVDAGEEQAARGAARVLCRVAQATPEVEGRRVRVLGPAPAPLSRLRGRYRFRLLLKSPDRRAMRRVAAALVARIDEGLAPARASLDVDPVNML